MGGYRCYKHVAPTGLGSELPSPRSVIISIVYSIKHRKESMGWREYSRGGESCKYDNGSEDETNVVQSVANSARQGLF